MTAKKKTTQKNVIKPEAKKAPHAAPVAWVIRGWQTTRRRANELLARRPHRTLRRTYRRDYVRSLQLPGYWAFTNYVRKTIIQRKGLFICLALFYGILSILLIGLTSQDAYTALADTIRETGSELFTGGWGEIGQATLLLASGLTGSWSSPLTEGQQIYAVLLGLLTWLTAVWLLRTIVAGGKPRLRDGLYNAGSPIVSTFIVSLVVIIQMSPIALAVAAFSAAVATGLVSGGGVEAMLFWIAITGLLGLSLYWITSTLVALVVVTLPGMYPFQAIKTAGDLVIGRRVRILLRLLWLGLTIGLSWLFVMVPIMLLDTWLKSMIPIMEWVPLVPIGMAVMSSLTIVWAASYVYLLYRKVVDDDAAPA